jgi:hypothetical protein
MRSARRLRTAPALRVKAAVIGPKAPIVALALLKASAKPCISAAQGDSQQSSQVHVFGDEQDGFGVGSMGVPEGTQPAAQCSGVVWRCMRWARVHGCGSVAPATPLLKS